MRACRLCLLIALLGATLCACNRSAPPPQEPIVITFAIPNFVTFFTKANFGKLADAFNQANPDAEVRLRTITVQEAMEVDDPYADIMLDEEWGIDAFFSGRGRTQRLADTGRILNLQPLLEADPAWEPGDFYPAVLSQFQQANDLWGVPTEFVPLVMFYNRDLFDQAGVPYPQPGWTRDDFLATTVALRAVLPETDFAFVGGAEAAVPFVYAHGGALLDQEGNCTLDDPLTAEALAWFFDLALAHGVMPTLAQAEAYQPELPPGAAVSVRVGVHGDGELGAGERRAMEAEGWLSVAAGWGDAALWSAPLWEQGGWQQVPWKFRWGVVPLPQDAVEVAMCDAFGGYVTAHSQHPQEALRWIQYLTRQRVDIAGIPARRSLAQSSTFRAALPQEIDQATLDALLALIERGQPLPLTFVHNRAAGCLGDAMIDIYERGVDVETALLEAQQRLSDAQKEQ